MRPLTGQRWDINIYSGLLQITFRGFCLHFLSLICFCCLGPLRFQAVSPPSHQPWSFHLHCFAASCSLHHSPKACRLRHETQVTFLLRHADPLAQKGVQTYKQSPPPPRSALAHTHTHTHKPGPTEISIWGLSCQTWSMCLSSVIMALFIFSDCPAGLGASRAVVLDVETLR